MKKNKILIFIVITVIAAVFTVAIINLSKAKPAGQNTQAQTYWTCPMHPSYISDKPGDCPICNMRLVEKKKAQQPAVKQEQKEKTAEEVCLEHKCSMKDCAMTVKANVKPGEKIICPICGEVMTTASGKVVEIAKTPAARKKILYYRNPMNPQAMSPVAMKDQMGMDYVPVYEEEKTGAGAGVYISPEKQQLIGVKTEAVKKINLTKVVRAFGKIAYDPELVVAQEEFVQALNTFDKIKESPNQEIAGNAKALSDASRKKLRLLGMSDDEIANLENTRKTEAGLYLPEKGGNVWVYIAVYEYEIGLIKIGQDVEIEATAYPGEIFSGKAVSINPVLDPQTRTNQVRVEVANHDSKLKPQMFVDANVKVDLGEKLAVPEAAVLDTGLRKIVYLSKEGDVLEGREITVGQKAQGYYEVISGLKEGDIVVTSGNFLVDSESKLKAASEQAQEDSGK